MGQALDSDNYRIFSPAWTFGCLLIVAFVFFGELTVVFHDYVFLRLGLRRDFVLMILWFLPVVASFIASYYSRQYGAIFGLTYIFVLPVIGASGHYISGLLGGAVDLNGISGALVIFKIDFVIGGITVITGTLAGVFLRSRKSMGSDSIDPQN